MAQQSWLGNIWDSITGRDKEPAGNGILNYQPEIKPAEDQGILSFLGPVGRTLQQAPAELPTSFVPSDPRYTPGLSESQFIYNQFLGEPIAKIGEGLEGVAQGFGFARQKEMGSLIPELTQSGKQVVGGSMEFLPVGGPSTMAARKGLLRGAEAVERSPVGQGILAMQEQRGMTPDGILGVSRMADDQPLPIAERPANVPEGQALQFLHNTSAEKLLRQERMGGMPMPSVGVTREDVPFEGFGDITLVGRKEAFDPRATKTNEIFSADAYTVRAPRPIRLANKDAYSRLKQEFGDVADRMGESIMSEQYELEALSRKGSSTESAYDNVVRFFEYDYVPRVKFLEEKGIEIPRNKDGKIDRWAADDIVNQDFREEFFEWADKKKDEYLTGQELFITNPDRDYVLQKPRYAEYTADNVTKYMKKRSGRGQEGGMGSTGVGAQRAATTEQLPSMKAMQERRGEFVPRDEVERLREQQEQNFFDLTDELRKFYKYDANSFSYLDEVSEMITLSERKGLSSALKEVGFKDVSPEVVEKINQYKDSLRSSPVQYFEAKPKRTVQLDEFAGAIVPEKTPQSVIDMLEAKGIKVEKYKNEEERLKLRSKFPNTMFSAAPAIPGAGLLADQEDKGENRPMRSLMDF